MTPACQKVVYRLSEFRPEVIEWLWPGRLALGTLALLDGDPGQGKSLLTLDLAARVSSGQPWPDTPVPVSPSSVILLGSEDSLTQTVVPRLQAAEADLERIHIFRARSPAGAERLPLLPADLQLLSDTIADTGARLVIIDPFLAFLGAEACGLNDQGVRQALTPLAQLAEQQRVVMVLVRHLTKKSTGQDALRRGAGAMAVMGSARTAFLVARHPHDADLRVLASSKNNLHTPPPTLAWRVELTPAAVPRVVWLGPVACTANELSAGSEREPGEALQTAQAFLLDVLAHGPVTRSTVVRQAHAVNIADRTLERGRTALQVHCFQKFEDNHNVWYWSLPDSDDSDRIMRDLFPDGPPAVVPNAPALPCS